MLMASKHIQAKLKELPGEPGCYFFKDAKGKVIYIGKAAVLKNRVPSYFKSYTEHSPKNQVLVTEIADVDWITVGSEVEALFLESEFIKRYKPKFNVALRDDKHWSYIKITMNQEFPVVTFVRRPMDDGATYFGPYSDGFAVRNAMKLLRKIFPFVTHDNFPDRACLHAHIGLCPGPEAGMISSAVYKRSLRQLMLYLSGEKDKLLKQLEREMKAAANKRDYELAAKKRNQLAYLRALGKQMVFGDKEAFDLTKDQALQGLGDRLGIPAPRRIEAYDISHVQGTDNVASMIVFTDGVADKTQYRRFSMRLRGNNDFAHMREVILRRFNPKNLTDWPKPDLLLIDGGKGQLGAALDAMRERGVDLPAIGLAKRLETIIVPRRTSKVESPDAKTLDIKRLTFDEVLLPHSSAVLQLLQRIRDEAHRFAVTYHALLRGKRQTKSLLDEIPGVGPATRKKLVKSFGSVRGVKAASTQELAEVIGSAKASVVKQHLG